MNNFKPGPIMEAIKFLFFLSKYIIDFRENYKGPWKTYRTQQKLGY